MKKVSTVAAKQSKNFSEQKLTIGLDLGDRWSWYCVLEEAGSIVLEQKLSTTPKAMREGFGGMPRSRIALETGMHSPWVSRLLSELGHEVIVAHARNVRLIGESRKKDDRLDARTLARLARIDPQFLLLDQHDAAMLLEASVEETLTEFISKGHESVSQLALGIGRGKLAEALVNLFRNVRDQVLPHNNRITASKAPSRPAINSPRTKISPDNPADASRPVEITRSAWNCESTTEMAATQMTMCSTLRASASWRRAAIRRRAVSGKRSSSWDGRSRPMMACLPAAARSRARPAAASI